VNTTDRSRWIVHTQPTILLLDTHLWAWSAPADERDRVEWLPDQVRTFEAVYEPTTDCGWWDLEVGVGRLF